MKVLAWIKCWLKVGNRMGVVDESSKSAAELCRHLHWELRNDLGKGVNGDVILC